MKRNIHVLPNPDGGWSIKRGGEGASLGDHPRKADAMKAARDIAVADQVERIEHGEDGRIMGSDSYGSDPRRHKG